MSRGVLRISVLLVQVSAFTLLLGASHLFAQTLDSDVPSLDSQTTLADAVRLQSKFLNRSVEGSSQAQTPATPPPAAAQAAAPDAPQAVRMTCASQIGDQRRDCAADTSSGVVLVRSIGAAPCLLGRTWGYDDKN